MPSSQASLLRFGVFELDLRTGELRKSGMQVKLQPQPFKVLALLASRANQVVAREEIQKEVWGSDTFVDFEHGLNFCIKQIRDALADDAESPRFIQTLPKRGYRFLVPVEPLEAASAQQETAEVSASTAESKDRTEVHPDSSLITGFSWAAAVLAGIFALLVVFNAGGVREKLLHILGGGSSGPIRSLAVLPLANLSGDPEQQFFVDGMTDELIAELARIRGLRVPSRTSVEIYKKRSKPLPEIARELRVDAIVEGSVLRSDDRVRITVQLLDGRKDQHLWGDSYERDLHDVLALQHAVATAITDQIKATLTPQEHAHLATSPPVNPEAYDAYLQGRFSWYKRTTEGLIKSIVYYEQAISKDPNYALAYAGLADSYALLGSAPNDAMPPRQAMPRAKAAARRALKLDDSLAEAHASLAYVSTFYDRDWATAEREFHRAIELNPHYATARQWYAEYLAARGRMDEALTEVKQARDDDPRELITHTAVAEVFYLSRQYDQVIEQCRKTLEFDPTFFLAHFHLGRAYLEKGMYTEAIAEFERAKKLSGENPAMVMALAYAHARVGHQTEARQALAELQARAKSKYVPALYFAAIHTGLGDNTQALAWLSRAEKERSDYLVYLNVEPMADGLRFDPRFQELLHRVGLSP